MIGGREGKREVDAVEKRLSRKRRSSRTRERAARISQIYTGQSSTLPSTTPDRNARESQSNGTRYSNLPRRGINIGVRFWYSVYAPPNWRSSLRSSNKAPIRI